MNIVPLLMQMDGRDAVKCHVEYSRKVRSGVQAGVFVTPEQIASFRVNALKINHPLLASTREWLTDSTDIEKDDIITIDALKMINPAIIDLLRTVNRRIQESGRKEILVLSGGSALRSLLGKNAWSVQVGRWEAAGSDYDLYVANAETPKDVRTVISMVAEHLSLIQMLYMGKGVVNFHVADPTGEIRLLKIQVMNMILPPDMSFLYGFDISACSVATDGNQYWITPPAAFAIANRLVIVDPLNTSHSAPNRIMKYFKRLGGMVLYGLPGFPSSETLSLCSDALTIDIGIFPCKGNQLAFAVDPYRKYYIIDQFKRFDSNYEDDEPDSFQGFFSNVNRVFMPVYTMSENGVALSPRKPTSLTINQTDVQINWADFVGNGLEKKDVFPLSSVLIFITKQLKNISICIDYLTRGKNESKIITGLESMIASRPFFKLLWFTGNDNIELIKFIMALTTINNRDVLRESVHDHLNMLVEKRMLQRWKDYPDDLGWTITINPAESQQVMTTSFSPMPMTSEEFYTIADLSAIRVDKGKVEKFISDLIKERYIASITQFGTLPDILKKLPIHVLESFATQIKDMLMYDKSCIFCSKDFDGGLNMAVLKCGHAIHVASGSSDGFCAGLFSLMKSNNQISCSRCESLKIRFNAMTFNPEKTEEQCSLCLTSLGTGENTAKLQCGHSFHIEQVNSENTCGGICCITNSSEGRPCPLCRAII